LDRIINIGGDNTSNSIPKEVQSFQEFLDEFPDWKDKKSSFIFHRDHPNVKDEDVLAQRVQKSGLCYIHAPDMVQHYVVSLTTKKNAGMIDISKMIHDTFSAQQLEEHIFNDKGGPSEIFLDGILQPNSTVLGCGYDQVDARLKQYGPLLICRFKVFEDFYNNDHFHHGANVATKFIGYHSMVLIGVRKESNGKLYYLLQNWWPKKQFIEVDELYLKNCKPALFYVETPQYEIPTQFQTNSFRYAENNVDKPESFPMIEGPLIGVYEK